MKAKNKCVFLDRDGTIIVDGEYNADVNKLTFINGVIKGLKKLQNEGFLLVIITNQSGIARGYNTENDVITFNNLMVEKLKNSGVNISAVYYCPHLENGVVKKYAVKCNCRKPQKGMFLKAVETFNIDLTKSYAIGDKLRDMCICDGSGCKGYLISNSESDGEYYKCVSSFENAVNLILGE